MGTKDNVINPFLAKPERFADILNQGSFQGNKVINPAKLTELDSTEKGIGSKTRDIKKLYNGNTKLAIIGIENQSSVHYAMVLRIWEYDLNTYLQQLKKISTLHEKEKDLKGDEWLSRFAKTDKLIPVITQVVYYGTKPWDGPRNLWEMLNVPDELKPYLGLIGNYSLNLLEVNEIQNLDCYCDDLKMVLGFVKYQKDKEKLIEFIQVNRELFEHVPMEIGRTIEVMANAREIKKYMDNNLLDEGGSINMCEALEAISKEGKELGENIFAELTAKLLEKNRTDDLLKATKDKNFRQLLYAEYGIS